MMLHRTLERKLPREISMAAAVEKAVLLVGYIYNG
jgi:hypothetical protein